MPLTGFRIPSGKGRFGDWLENIQDWGISRNRYWGTPLNIWECECGHQHSIGSIEELKSLSDNCLMKLSFTVHTLTR